MTHHVWSNILYLDLGWCLCVAVGLLFGLRCQVAPAAFTNQLARSVNALEHYATFGSLTVFFVVWLHCRTTNFQDVGKGGTVIRQPGLRGLVGFVTKMRVTQRTYQAAI